MRPTIRPWRLGLTLSALICASSPVYAASFDCSKAHSHNEKLICSDPQLSALDDDLGAKFKTARASSANKPAFDRASAAQWMWREKHCSDKECLLAWYTNRMAALSGVETDSSRPHSTEPSGGWRPAADAISISASALFRAYQSNEINADNLYKGKKLAVRGIVTHVAKDITGDPYLTLAADPYGVNTVNAYFSPAAQGRLATISRGTDITLTCTGNGVSLTSPVLDCHN